MGHPQLHLQVPSSTSATGLPGSNGNGTASLRHRHDKYPSKASTNGYSPVVHNRKNKRRDKGKGRAYEEPWNATQWVKEGFRRFGEHCTRNQIRTLLIDCLVMTHLFYPSLAVYLQKKFPPLRPPTPPSAHNVHRVLLSDQGAATRKASKEHPLSLLSTPILDSFFPYPPPLLPSLPPVHWWGDGHEDFSITRVMGPEAESRTGEDEVHILRVGWADVGEVLDGPAETRPPTWIERDEFLERSVRSFVEGWEEEHSGSGEGCVRRLTVESNSGENELSRGPCYFMSTGPRADDLTTPLGLGIATVESSIYHSISTLFRVPHTSRTDFERRWTNHLSAIANASSGELFEEACSSGKPSSRHTDEWVLSYIPERSGGESKAETSSNGVLSAPWLAYLSYAALFAGLAFQISYATKAHSRFGLAFTGIVQLCCSAVMSFSIVSLFGWNGWGASMVPTTLPTYFLPFVIVVVGVENMSTLTKAVFSVPFTYTVSERMGLALSKVGVRIALTSLQDLILMGLTWLLVDVQPVREFCVFAAVVVITDWFMLHTFFLTVLSIDAQRLELADILSSAPNGAPPQQAAVASEEQDWALLSWRSLARARSLKTIALLFLCLCVGLMHSRNHPTTSTTASLYGYNPSSISMAPSPIPYNTSPDDLVQLSPAETFWRTINPSGFPFVRIVSPPASLLVLPRFGHSMLPSDIRKLHIPTTRLLLPRLKPLFYLFKVVFLPQAVTAAALYFLLRFLLKDAELLDAQRNRLGRNEVAPVSDDKLVEGGEKVNRLLAGMEAHMLPCSHSADIDIIVSSEDGNVVLSVGLDNSVCLWRFSNSSGTTGTREELQLPASNDEIYIVAAAVSHNGKYAAVGTSGNMVHIWEIIKDGPPQPESPHKTNGTGMISDLIFDNFSTKLKDTFRTPSSFNRLRPSLFVTCGSSVLSIHPDGTIAQVVGPSFSQSIDQPRPLVECRNDNEGSTILIGGMTPQLFRQTTEGWTSRSFPDIGDNITCISSRDDFLALGHKDGSVIIYDLSSLSPLTTIETQTEPISQICLGPYSTIKCSRCGISSEGMIVVFSTLNRIFIDRMLPRGSPQCRCYNSIILNRSDSLLSPTRAVTSKTSLARSNSLNGSPSRSPSLIQTPDFPISSHGARRPSPQHRDDPDPFSSHINTNGEITSSEELTYEVRSLISLMCSDGGWIFTSDQILMGIHKKRNGINDSSFQIFFLDTTSIHVNPIYVNLDDLEIRSRHLENTSMSIKERKTERNLSLSGRSSFPKKSGSLILPVYPELAFIKVRPVVCRGKKGLIAGFGNKLGMVILPLEEKRVDKKKKDKIGLGNGLNGGMGLTPPPPKRNINDIKGKIR
ncbi:hypothetical protein M231_02275 [Tremella mesenterica]|uniref:Sterol regulatory element-binding protein cleavage-activating protein n=1 Tax=Tremella mesenterica TaxID=5217 RepID=A0A4Q1BRE0_TREME|nr:uncharacterized protein TREMEDRAFT_65412 [Tremella mesenterica DSM 1558]EIW66542.1 hypothetical protein TREMEDRAFT_65412 [Tremella mesenterica DSM 1558]RXK40442.1 hypothetical protein M231_02275 [Tremella mesenterica]